MDNFTYGGIVNKACEISKFSEMSIDQFKCLIFVMGLKSQSDPDIRTKLLEKLDKEHTTITLNDLISEYDRLMIVKKDSNMIQNKATNASVLLNTVKSKRKSPNGNSFKCYNCDTNHPRYKCPNEAATCEFCSSKGHSIKFCRKKQAEDSKSKENKTKDQQISKFSDKPTNYPKHQSRKPNVSNVFVHEITMNSQRRFIDIQISNKPIRLQIDSGGDISIISENTCSELNIPFNKTSVEPSDASGNSMNLIGEFECLIDSDNKLHRSKLFVSKNEF